MSSSRAKGLMEGSQKCEFTKQGILLCNWKDILHAELRILRVHWYWTELYLEIAEGYPN